jgi:type II secretory pathway pseudopilin PulG
MKKHSCRRGYGAREAAGFTLVEILVAEAIFLILLVVVIQLIFGVIETAASQKKRMDSLEDARQSLDRLSLDWSGRVRRSDVKGAFARDAAVPYNAQIGFLTEIPAYSGARHLSWVSYGVNAIPQVNQGSKPTSTLGMVRGILGYNWSASDGAANPLMTFPAGASTPSSGTPTVEPLANTVFRFEFCFLQQVPTVPSATTTSPLTVNNALDLTSPTLVGVVVTVAALDQQSRQILTSDQVISLAKALPKIGEGANAQTVWLATINSNGFAATAGVPQTVASAVRVFQRILYIKE